MTINDDVNSDVGTGVRKIGLTSAYFFYIYNTTYIIQYNLQYKCTLQRREFCHAAENKRFNRIYR
jgi:hypothetical protein